MAATSDIAQYVLVGGSICVPVEKPDFRFQLLMCQWMVLAHDANVRAAVQRGVANPGLYLLIGGQLSDNARKGTDGEVDFSFQQRRTRVSVQQRKGL